MIMTNITNMIINYLNKIYMKNVFEIPNIGGMIVGTIGDLSIEDIINAVRDANGKIEESKVSDKSKAYEFINEVIEIVQNEGRTFDDYVQFMADEAKTDTACFYPVCLAEKFSKLTVEEMILLGADNCATVIKAIKDYIATRSNRCVDAIETVERKCRIVASKCKTDSPKEAKSYEDMSREELIAELKGKK